ncbi:HVA1 family protein [Herbiconiux sp. CPCC 205716]|uniref:HVA1 family protein n=1 Tax=Herbiconiux gentiana TaxID=2970912 RepID=A0ABT2GH14_9MICO|nr:HVA1 family protein [Herbiconiux gentiana]MCS5715510.1 HVA1 family protein [Herbiconiux gentiana]
MPAPATHRTSGLIIALAAAAAFGTSGPFVKPLLDAGWSPAAAVAVRAVAGGLVLLPAALVALRGRWGLLFGAWRLVLAYGLVAVIGAQVFYFAAISRMPVGIALLIEYTAPILLVLLAWARTRIPPALLTIVGAVLSIAGLVLVIDPSGAGGLDALGVVFALCAALCLAGYYLIAALPTGDLPPVTLVSAGLVLGGVVLGGVGAAGVVPFTFSFEPVVMPLVGEVSWMAPMAVVVLVATAFAYLAGIIGAIRLGSRVASFVGLVEVLFAVLFAWLLLGEAPTWLQLTGGALIVAGVVFVKVEREGSRDPVGGSTVQPMTKKLSKGDHVEWSTHGTTTSGEVEKTITSDTEAAGRTVRASDDDPQYLVKSDKSGREAVHKPEALKKTSS